MSEGEKGKVPKPRKAARASSSEKEEKETKVAAKRAAGSRATKTTPAKKAVAKAGEKPEKAAKKAVAKPAGTTARKKATAAKPATRKRARAGAVSSKLEIIEPARDVVIVAPHSTIEGAEPHIAAIGPTPVVAIQASKYEVTPPDRIIEPLYPEERVTELPAQYGDTKLVLLVRDPEWLFLYWEISRAHREMLGLPPQGTPERLVVRLHDTTDVEEFNGTNAPVWYEIPITGEAISWYIHLPQVDRAWCAELGVLNEQGEFIQICRSNMVRTPRNYISAEADAEWMTVSEELREILARSADVAVSSRLGSEAAIRQISRRMRLALEKHEMGSAVVSGSLRAVRVAIPEARAISPDLPLTVRVELVVSGSTDPHASLTIQGRPVAVRSDGSFSLRFELPDGEQVIAVRAVSSDGALSREIVPVVRRETRPPSGS